MGAYHQGQWSYLSCSLSSHRSNQYTYNYAMNCLGKTMYVYDIMDAKLEKKPLHRTVHLFFLHNDEKIVSLQCNESEANILYSQR